MVSLAISPAPSVKLEAFELKLNRASSALTLPFVVIGVAMTLLLIARLHSSHLTIPLIDLAVPIDLLWLIPVLWLINLLRKHMFASYILTEREIVQVGYSFKTGKFKIAIPYQKIVGISVKQGFLGRKLDYGDLLIVTRDTTTPILKLKAIFRPVDLAVFIDDQREFLLEAKNVKVLPCRYMINQKSILELPVATQPYYTTTHSNHLRAH